VLRRIHKLISCVLYSVFFSNKRRLKSVADLADPAEESRHGGLYDMLLFLIF